jgi:hypothetical protein
MSKHITISPAEAADRLAIRELVEAYAHCADRRAAKGQMLGPDPGGLGWVGRVWSSGLARGPLGAPGER